MQIKRFEAADMTEALRMVKRDFGDDAVILSAKEIRPGGFFSALKKKRVVITAAIDYQGNADPSTDSFANQMAEQLDDAASADRVSISGNADPQTQDRSGRSPMAMNLAESQREKVSSRLAALKRYGKAHADCTDSQKTGMDRRVAEPFFRLAKTGHQQRIAMVGPSGAGKSTAIVKLARFCQMVEKKKTALISLDRYRMGANGLLENVARILKIEVAVVHAAHSLDEVLAKLAGHDVVLVDTPGMNGTDEAMLDEVGRMLFTIHPDETHLVLNATVRERFLVDAVDRFMPLGVNRLMLTHLDAYGSIERTADILGQKNTLAASFYGDGVDLFDGLIIAHDHQRGPCSTADRQPPFAPDRKFGGADVVLSDDEPPSVDIDGAKYVANRNSELFHHPTCKSVRRINAENITTFNSIEQAMEEGFKPCRACCSVSTSKKPALQTFGFQRASAL